jgi:CDP-diacylglycerol--glycerol-3-phosphate 3-phosphatidyltransferase
MIDGTIARRTGAVSNFGEKLDTVADFVFMAVCVVKLLPEISVSIWLWIWIAVIAIVKVTNMVMGFVHSKRLVALHTALNKTTGLLLFLLPLTLQFIEPIYSLAIVCTIATIAAIQEGCYAIKVNNK